MARRKPPEVSFADLPDVLPEKLRPPFGVVLGSPHEAAELAGVLEPNAPEVVCYQMDLYQAERLREELRARGVAAQVTTAPDLWDLPSVQTLVYPVPQRGERILKLDMLEQAYHTLRPHGCLVVVSPYEKDAFVPDALKKLFGRVHAPAAGSGVVFWAQRGEERPRRRHEVTFHVAREGAESLRFLSRPGTFSYGRFDNGARALVESIEVRPGERILDVGCGCGTNGVCAGLRAGEGAHVAFLDSNVRALVLAEQNARENGLESFEVFATSRVDGVPEGSFDVALANPPYYAQLSIARLFIERSAMLLKRGGRFYLVTRQPDQVGPVVAETFGLTEVAHRRNYTILSATRTR